MAIAGVDRVEPRVEAIMAADIAAFDTWLESTGPRRLDMPRGVMRFLIPPILFTRPAIKHPEINPENLDAFPAQVLHPRLGPNNLEFYIGEREGQSESESHYLYGVPAKTITTEIERGTFDADTLLIHRIHLAVRNGNELEVVDYADRPKLRESGIATSFYERLRAAAQMMGFRYIVGENNFTNMGYFVKKLKRLRVLWDLNEGELKTHFLNTYPPTDKGGVLTVDFLDPHEKRAQTKKD